MKTRHLIALGVLAAALGGFAWWRVLAAHAALIAALPPRPDLHAFPDELTRRIATCEQIIRTGNATQGVAALAELGPLYHANGFAAAASRCYAELLERDTRNPRWPYLQATLLSDSGRLDDALPLLRRTVALAPDYAPARLRLADVLAKLNQPAETARLRATVENAASPDRWLDDLAIDCYDAYRLMVAASAAEIAGDISRARTLLERAVTLAPDNASAHRQLGVVLMKARESTAALPHLVRATTLAPDEADNWVQLFLAQRALGQSAAADATLAAGLARNPQSPSLHLESGRCLVAAGRPDAALAEFQTARRLRPQEAEPSMEIAAILFRRGDVTGGLAEVRAALAAQPDHAPALFLLARDAIANGDEPRARELLARLRKQSQLLPADFAIATSEYQQRFGRPAP